MGGAEGDLQVRADTARWPLDRPESEAYRTLVEDCRAALARDGMFSLAGFIDPAAAQALAGDLEPRFASEAFAHRRSHNIYFRDHVPGLAPDHGALARMETSNRTLCADQLTGPLMALYRWPPLARFLADCLDKAALHTMDDPLAAVNVMRYGEGEALNWHFDRSEFTTTLLLQAPESGGAFQYRAGLRTEDDPNHDGVARLLAGQDDEVRQVDLSPGTLNVFRGKNTAHRVTPPRGVVPRVIAVFSYYEEPGVVFSEAERVGFYGRAG